MSWARPDPDAGPLLEERPRLVGLVERRGRRRPGRSTARASRPAGATAGTRWPSASRARIAGNSSRVSERCVHVDGQPARERAAPGAGPETDGCPALDETPRLRGPTARRRSRRRSAGRRDDRRGRPVRRRRLQAQRRRRVTQVEPGPAGVQPERGGDEPGPARETVGGQARSAAASASARSGGQARRRVVVRTTRSRRIASMPSSGSTARMSSAAGRAARARSPRSGSRTSRRQGTRRRARRPEHDPVPGGLAEAGVRRPVVAADVGLDLDDPPDPSAGRVVADQARPDESRGRPRGSVAPGGPGRGRSAASVVVLDVVRDEQAGQQEERRDQRVAEDHG